MSDIGRIQLDSEESIRKLQEEALGYLAFLNLDAAYQAAEYFKLNCDQIVPTKIQTPEDCLMCLESFLKVGIWLGHLFSRGDVWGIYIKSRADAKYHTALSLIFSIGGPADLMLYLRACYRFGYQVIPDQEYDVLERLYLGTFSGLSFLNEKTNDDDDYTEIVKQALSMSGFRSSVDSPKPANLSDVTYAALNAEKSTSIRPVRSYKELYDYLVNAPVCPTHWSLKMDGFYTKLLLKDDGTLDIALSRGRATDSWDYTEAIARALKYQGVDTSKLFGRISGESLVSSKALDYLRAKYPDKEYKTPKSTAGAMLRAPQQFDESDYQYLKFYPFEYQEFYKDKAFEILADAGFEVPPNIRVEAGEIPLENLEVFKDWLDKTILDPIWERVINDGLGKESTDGVVLQLLTDIENDRADKYSDLNVAIKFSHWTEQEYESEVVNILFEQNRVEMSIVLEIKPITTRDLNVATRVSVGSPAILVRDNVRVGDRIRFSRKSEAINVYEGKVV